MAINKSRIALALAAVAYMILPGTAAATNGYFAHGYGTANKALGGAGVAFPQSAMQAATNPAGMVDVGERFDIGIEAFNPMRDYQSRNNPLFGSSAQDSENEWFFIPHIGYNYMLSKTSSVGLTLYGNGGMNTRYSQPVFGAVGSGNDRTGVNLAQLFAAFSYSQKLGDSVSIGVAPIFVYQRIAFEGFSRFNLFGTTSDAANLSNNGADNSYGGGYRIGGTVDVGGGITLGGAYQSRMRMSKFHKYGGLFAEGGDFDVPPTYTVGFVYQPTKKVSIAFDYQYIAYGDIETLGNGLANILTPGQNLGTENGPGFGWNDIKIYKLGLQLEASKNLTLRIGGSRGDNPVRDGFDRDANGNFISTTQFNIIAPGVLTTHYTLGMTYKLAGGNEFSMAYMHAKKNSITGQDTFAPSGTTSTELTMSQNALELSYGIKW